MSVLDLTPLDPARWTMVEPPFGDALRRTDLVLGYYDGPLIWTVHANDRDWCVWWVDILDEPRTDRWLVFPFAAADLERMRDGMLTCCEFIRTAAEVYLADESRDSLTVHRGTAADLHDDHLPTPDAMLRRGEV